MPLRGYPPMHLNLNPLAQPRRISRPSSRIDGSVLIVANPKAGNGVAMEKAGQLYRLLKEGRSVPVAGEVRMVETHPDPTHCRAQTIVHAKELNRLMPQSKVVGVAIGGNDTANRVMHAGLRLIDDGIDFEAVAGPGGRIGDLQCFAGTPDDVAQLPRFIAGTLRARMNGLEVIYDGNRREVTFHGMTMGTGSGTMYEELDRRYETEPVMLKHYLAALPRAMLTSEDMIVRIDNDRLIDAAEVFVTINGRQGSVANTTTSDNGARVFFVPRFPYGALPVAEALVRGGLTDLGFQRYAEPLPGLIALPRSRQVDLMPGDEMRLSFFNGAGINKFVPGTITGNHAVGSTAVMLRMMKQSVPVIVGDHSLALVHRSRVRPRVPFDGITRDTVGGVLEVPKVAAAAISLIAGGVASRLRRKYYETYRAKESRDQRKPFGAVR